MVSVLPEHSTIDKAFKSANVILTSDNPDFPRAIEELKDPEATTIAMAYATKQGMREPRANRSNGATYPVNRDGENILKLMNEGVKAGDDRAQISSYRVEIKLIAPPM